jgi:hypothetical protein
MKEAKAKEKKVLILLPVDQIKEIKREKPRSIYLSEWWRIIVSAGLNAIRKGSK